MEYVKFGNTGMDVSRICLGCMSFGDPDTWLHKWALKEEESRPIIKRALELGINFFDTANVYSLGRSEEILGRAIKDFAKRDEVVIATKVHGKMHEGPNGSGLSRKSILSEIDNSLKRLDMDYVDLYIIHRWDYNTPIEETMEALHDVVKSGKARYIGASAMYAWQFQKALHVAEKNGWTRFVSMQNHLNLLYRENLSLATIMAGKAFSNASLGLVHAMAHSLGAHCDAFHGEANALLLEEVIDFNFSSAKDRYTRIAKILIPELSCDEKEVKEILLSALREFRINAGLNSNLSKWCISHEDIVNLAQKALLDPCLATNPRVASQNDIISIYERATK